MKKLPRRLFNAWDIALESFFAETNTAQVEITHKCAWATTLEASADGTRRKLRLAKCFHDH